MSLHKITVTRAMGDPDLGAEEEVEITFGFHPGRQAVMYLRNGDPGHPADPHEIEFVSCKPEFPDSDSEPYLTWIKSSREEWARDWIGGGDHDDEIIAVVDADDDHAREQAAEMRAEMRAEDRRDGR